MEQIAAKVASLVAPPVQQHRGELVVDKPSAEKGRRTRESRGRRPEVDVKGAGGILVLGGLLVTAAVAAGVAIVARRAKRQPASKKEKVESLNGNDKLGDSRIDGSAGIQEEDCVSCDGVEELRNGRELDWQQLDAKNWGKTDLGLQNGTGKKENDKQASLGEAELVNAVKICLSREEEEEEEEDKEASPVEAKASVNHYETELTESVPASGNGEKEDEPALNQSTEVEISKQECENVHDRDEKVFPFLAESKEIVEQQKVEEHEILTVESEDKVNQHQTEQISESELALVNDEEEEPKEPPFALSVGQQTEHVFNEHDLTKIEEHIEEKEETEAFAEGNEEKTEAEDTSEGENDVEEIEDEKEAKRSPEEGKKAEDEEAIEEKKEPESSVEGEEDGTYHIMHSEVSTEDFSTTKETEETDEKAQPASLAEEEEEEEESNDNQTQAVQVIDEHEQQKEDEILTVEYEGKVNQHPTEQISGSEIPFALKEDEKEAVKALSVGQRTEHVLNEHDLTKIEEQIEEKEEIKASPEGNEEKIEEKKEAAESQKREEDEEEIEDEKELKTSPEEEEKSEDEEAIEEEKALESSGEGEDDGIYSNKTQTHIIHSKVSAEETDEKTQPASLDEEGGGCNHNQTQTNTADPQFSTEDYKLDSEKGEPESFPEEEAQMRDDGSDSAPVSSAQGSNEAAISPAEEVEQGKILTHEVESKVSSDYSVASGEVKVEMHAIKAEEKPQESIAERENILDNMVHADKAEDKKEEESMIGREEITKDEMQQQLLATIRKKALMLEKLLMDIPDRLLVVLLVISLTMVLLHYVKPFSQLYQMISPSAENSQGI